jgi:hypothetical protein
VDLSAAPYRRFIHAATVIREGMVCSVAPVWLFFRGWSENNIAKGERGGAAEKNAGGNDC